jgi:hypothetical protein
MHGEFSDILFFSGRAHGTRRVALSFPDSRFLNVSRILLFASFLQIVVGGARGKPYFEGAVEI